MNVIFIDYNATQSRCWCLFWCIFSQPKVSEQEQELRQEISIKHCTLLYLKLFNYLDTKSNHNKIGLAPIKISFNTRFGNQQKEDYSIDVNRHHIMQHSVHDNCCYWLSLASQNMLKQCYKYNGQNKICPALCRAQLWFRHASLRYRSVREKRALPNSLHMK